MKSGWAFMIIMMHTFFWCNFVLFEYYFLLSSTLNLILKYRFQF